MTLLLQVLSVMLMPSSFWFRCMLCRVDWSCSNRGGCGDVSVPCSSSRHEVPPTVAAQGHGDETSAERIAGSGGDTSSTWGAL